MKKRIKIPGLIAFVVFYLLLVCFTQVAKSCIAPLSEQNSTFAFEQISSAQDSVDLFADVEEGLDESDIGILWDSAGIFKMRLFICPANVGYCSESDTTTPIFFHSDLPPPLFAFNVGHYSTLTFIDNLLLAELLV